MKKLLIDIDYNRPEPKTEEERKGFLSNSELSANYVDYAAKTKYKDGMSTLQLRNFGRIQRKLDDAILNKDASISLETAEVDLLRGIFKDDVLFPSSLAKYVVLFLDEIEKLTDVKEKEEKKTE